MKSESLSRDEMAVLCLRFGLDEGGKTRTLEDAGKAVHMTRETVRAVEARAISKMRRALAELIAGGGAPHKVGE